MEPSHPHHATVDDDDDDDDDDDGQVLNTRWWQPLSCHLSFPMARGVIIDAPSSFHSTYESR